MKTRRSTKQNYKSPDGNLFGNYLYMLVNRNIRHMASKFSSILNTDDINDLVHEAWLKIQNKKYLFREDGNFEGWVFRICQNFVKGIAPKFRRHYMEVISYNADGADDSISNDCDYLSYMADCTYSPDREICEREAQERIMWAIGHMKGENFQVANMMLEGYSSEDMENELDCTNGALRVKICRLRKTFRSYGICG